MLQLTGNEDVQLLILAGWGFAYPNKAFQGQVCWEVSWWVSVCLSVCLDGWMDGWGGGLFFVLFLPLVKFKQYAVTRTKCHFPAIHLNLASILKLTFDLLKC